MAYYWVTQAQRYLQSLGFGVDPAGGEQAPAAGAHQPVRRRQLVLPGPGQDADHHVRQGRRGRRRGRRGRRARVRPLGARRPGAAASAARRRPARSRGVRRLPGRLGQALGVHPGGWVPRRHLRRDWDRLLHPVRRRVEHCLRRVDANRRSPTSRAGARRRRDLVAALWDIRTALGDTVANRIIINAQFSFRPTPASRPRRGPVTPAMAMYGQSAANTVTAPSTPAASSAFGA